MTLDPPINGGEVSRYPVPPAKGPQISHTNNVKLTGIVRFWCFIVWMSVQIEKKCKFPWSWQIVTYKMGG